MAEHASVDGEPIRIESNTIRVGEVATRAVELTADVGADQAYLAAGRELLAADQASVDGEPIRIEGDPPGLENWPRVQSRSPPMCAAATSTHP